MLAIALESFLTISSGSSVLLYVVLVVLSLSFLAFILLYN